MFEFYFSKDLGLLDHKSKEFRMKRSSFRKIYNPTLEELKNFLIHKDIENGISSCIVENYSDSIEDLESFLIETNLSDQNVLILVKLNSEYKASEGLREICSNNKVELISLNEKTKRSYINSSIKAYKLNLESDLVNFIKEILPPDALVINEFIARVSLLQSDKITKELLLEFLDVSSLEASFFNFWDLFFEQSENWLIFFNNHVRGNDSLRKCFFVFANKSTDLKLFLDYRISGIDLLEIEKKLKIKKYFLFDMEKILKMYGPKLLEWLDKFIVDLCFFQKNLLYPYHSSISLFKWFLVKQKNSLETW